MPVTASVGFHLAALNHSGTLTSVRNTNSHRKQDWACGKERPIVGAIRNTT